MRTTRTFTSLLATQNRVSRLRLTLFALCLAGATALAPPVHATTISAAGTEVQNSIPGGGLGTDGYIMYDEILPANGGRGPTTSTANNIQVTPAYVSAITPYSPSATYYNAPHGVWTVLTIAGTQYDSGAILRSDAGGTLATITLTGAVPNSFQLGLLGDNENDNGVGHRNASFTVTALGSGSTATQIPGGTLSTNRFYLFNVSDVTASDVITISGVAGIDGLILGGITFSTPEPSSYVLLTMSIVGLWCVARRNRSRSATRVRSV